jgi:gamma-glutamyltranspeptidase/glutathione hydrolase
LLAVSAKALRADDYGRATFFRLGMPLEAGDVVRQPELASVLTELARHGASYMYTGEWATRFLKVAQSHGGLIAPSDLSGYRAVWRVPWQTSYRGYTVHASSGTSFGGPWSLLALKALEHTQLAPLGHPSQSARAMELVLRTARQVWSEPWIFDYDRLQNPKFVASKLTSEYASGVWRRVENEAGSMAVPKAGSHSYHIIVVDKEGNIASGTNTHESLGWCDGLFVDGVLLPSSGYLPWSIRPGERRLSPFTLHMVGRDDAVRFAAGSFSTGILEASLQFLVNLIDYRLSPQEASSKPRFGTFPNSPESFMSAEGASKNPTLKAESNVLDSRIGSSFAAELEGRGLSVVPDSAQRRWEERECERLSKEGFACTRTAVDTGLGTLVAIRADGTVEGATAPWPGVTSPLREPASPAAAGRSR